MKNSKFKFLKSLPFLLYFSLLTFLISCHEAKPNDQENLVEENLKVIHDNIITLGDAEKLYRNYSKMRINIDKDTLQRLYGSKFEDTRMVWFDLKTIKNYIEYIEKRSAENKIAPEGLQFYFSVYPDDEKKYGDERNHQTFFIAPTTSNNDVQSGYTLNGEKVIFLKNVLANNEDQTQQKAKVDKASFFSTTLDHDDGLLLNRGGGTPPGGNDEM